MRFATASMAWAVVVAAALALGCGNAVFPADVPFSVTVVAVDVNPPSVNLMPGTTQTFAATIRLSNGMSRQPSAREVTWSSSMPTVATIDAAGVATVGTGGGITAITATVGTGAAMVRGTALLTVTLCHCLDGIQVTPVMATVAVGGAQSFVAIGHYMDGATYDVTSQVQWATSMPAIATIDATGTAHGVAAGTTLVRASMGTVQSNTPTLTVNVVPLISITLTPGVLTLMAGSPTASPIRATGNYADGSTRDLTEEPGIVWATSAPGIATVSSTAGTRGQVTASATMTGSANITAALGGITSAPAIVMVVASSELRSIAVTPSPVTLGPGGTRPLVATGTFTDGRSADVTTMATWSSSAPATATVGARTGIVRGVANGTATITATIGTVSGAAMLTVTGDIILISIEVTPVLAALGVGDRQVFTVTGIYLDGTSRPVTTGITWSSTNTRIAVVDATGAATALEPGSTTIRAQVGGVMGTATLAVRTVEPVALAISPSDFTLILGVPQQLRATASFNDGTVADVTSSVTWSSDLASVAAVSPTGLVTGASVGGPVGIRAVIPGGARTLRASVNVTTTTGFIRTIDLSPATATALPGGASRAFSATAVYATGLRRVIDDAPGLSWTSSDPSVATIGTAPGAGRGVATAVAPGTTQIRATYNNGVSPPATSAPTTLTVTPAVLTRIDLSAPFRSAAIGFHARFTATGVYSDGTTLDLTDDPALAWTTADTAIASIGTAPGPWSGVASCTAVGTVEVRATVGAGAGAVVGRSDLACAAGTLVALALAPTTADLAIAAPGLRFTASGTFTDGTTRDVTDEPSMIYASSDPLRVQFDRGVAAAIATATPATGITLTVRFVAVRGTATVNVVPPMTP